jgi:hypothetical protein
LLLQGGSTVGILVSRYPAGTLFTLGEGMVWWDGERCALLV